MHALCAQSFVGSHMCHAAEYALANVALDVPASGAWVDPSAAVALSGNTFVEMSSPFFTSVDSARAVAVSNPRAPADASCNQWQSTNAAGAYLTNAGPALATDCAAARVVACCSTRFRERLAGYTSATTTGAIGGRSGANRRCQAEFPGSHICHSAEYARATPSSAPPAQGAWIDRSFLAVPSIQTSPNPDILGTQTFSGHARAGRRMDDPTLTPNCANWTSGSNSVDAAAVVQAGILSSSSCDALRSLACCL